MGASFNNTSNAFVALEAARGAVKTAAADAVTAGEGIPPVAPSANLTVAEWRDLANCWRIINNHGADARLNSATNGSRGLFPATDTACSAVTGGDGTIANDPFTISSLFRGRSMQAFMEVPEFRVYCVVARPFIEHLMHSAIMTVSGRDTGAMLFGPSDMCVPFVAPRPLPFPCIFPFPAPPLADRIGCCVRAQANLREHTGQDHRGASASIIRPGLPPLPP